MLVHNWFYLWSGFVSLVSQLIVWKKLCKHTKIWNIAYRCFTLPQLQFLFKRLNFTGNFKNVTHTPTLATINWSDLCSEILLISRTIFQAKSCLENLWTLCVRLQQEKPATLAAIEAPVLKLFLWMIIVPQHDIVTSLPLLPCVWAVLKTFNVSWMWAD